MINEHIHGNTHIYLVLYVVKGIHVRYMYSIIQGCKVRFTLKNISVPNKCKQSITILWAT